MLLIACGCSAPPHSDRRDSGSQFPSLNSYVLKAVVSLNGKYGGLGYDNDAFTHDLIFGNEGTLAASNKPLTMCVAAQLEVLVEALNQQALDSSDYRAFAYLPKSAWARTRPTDFRGQVWIVAGSDGHGMADALERFGMGARHSFDQWRPGDFINFNRTNGTGHGAVFLGYLDRHGDNLDHFGENVAGFKYFSSQGKGTAGGLGYRYAFFSPFCPNGLSAGRKRDCGVVRSNSGALLNGGTAWLPIAWIQSRAVTYMSQHQKSDERDGQVNIEYFTGLTTDDQ
jgi:hypothetical protein